MQRGYRNGYVAKVYRASGTRLLTSPAPVIVATLPMQPVQLMSPVQPIAVADGPRPGAAVVPVTGDVAAVPASSPAPPAWDVFAQTSTAHVFASSSKGSN